MKTNISGVINKVFDEERKKVFLKLAKLNAGVLAGGTALALQLVHRLSFDFDIFSPHRLPTRLLKNIEQIFGPQVLRPVTNTLEFVDVILAPDIHLHFVHFPHHHLHPIITAKGIPLFDIHDLASNKAYSMGHRPAWRDYVDIFFILKKGIRLETIIQDAKKRFEGKFDEKLFLEQLVYIKDIQDFSTSYISKSYTPEEIKKFFEKETERYLAQKIS